jgi:hypothetical protein
MKVVTLSVPARAANSMAPVTVLDRVAAAIGAARRPRRGHMPTDHELAVAALRALREPTPDMVNAALRVRVQGNVFRTSSRWNRAKQVARYRAAIDAALNENGQPVGNVLDGTRRPEPRHQPRFL